MVDRIKCASCGAEGMADGKLHCDACYTELLRRKREGQHQAAQRIAELSVQLDRLTEQKAILLEALSDAVSSVACAHKGICGDCVLYTPQIDDRTLARWQIALSRVRGEE